MANAHDYFLDEFKGRCSGAIEQGILTPDEPLYVLPFYTMPERLDDDFWAGLWVPRIEEQEYIGNLDHWRLSQELANAAGKRGLRLQSIWMRANLHIDSNSELTVKAHDFALPRFGNLREDLEERYGVKLVELSEIRKTTP